MYDVEEIHLTFISWGGGGDGEGSITPLYVTVAGKELCFDISELLHSFCPAIHFLSGLQLIEESSFYR